MPTLTVIVEQLLAPVPGGTGRVTAELVSAMQASAPAGWRLRTICAFHRDITPAVIPGPGEIAEPAELRPHRLLVGRRILAELWSRGLPPWVGGDVVLATTPLFPPRSPPWRRPGGTHAQRRLVIVHDAVPWTHPETLSPRGVHWHRTMIERAAMSSVLITPGQAAADALAAALGSSHGGGTRGGGEHAPAAAPGVQMLAVPWGVSQALQPPTDAVQRRDRLGLPARYLVFVGTVEPRKGLDVLIAALGAVDPADRIPLVLIGPNGWGDVDPAGSARASGLPAEAIRATGKLADVDLAAVLQGALALVAPSRSEGFGLPVLEAMTLRVPVVISDAPALTEVVAGAALVTPVGDVPALAEALARISGDDALRRELAERGARRAAEFTWARAAEQVWSQILRPAAG